MEFEYFTKPDVKSREELFYWVLDQLKIDAVGLLWEKGNPYDEYKIQGDISKIFQWYQELPYA